MGFSDAFEILTDSLSKVAVEHEREISALRSQIAEQQIEIDGRSAVNGSDGNGEGENRLLVHSVKSGKTVHLENVSLSPSFANSESCSTSYKLKHGVTSAEVLKRTLDHPHILHSFELKDEWTKVPEVAEHEQFLDEVDKMLVETAATQMQQQRKKSYRSTSMIVNTPMRDFLNQLLPHSFILHPSSPQRMAWDVFGMLLIIYDMTTLFFWTIDIFMSLITGFYRKGRVVMDLPEIWVNYVEGWFWIDLVVVVPDWTFKVMGSVTNAAGLGRVLRFARIVRVLRLIRLLKLKRLFNLVYDMCDSEVTFIVLNLIKLLVLIIFMNHMVACGWYAVGRFSKDNGFQKNWLENVGETPVWGESLAWTYLTSLHWSLTQFTPASMDIYATNTWERLYSVIVLLWALVALSSIIGSVSAQMTALRNMSVDENKQFWLLRRYMEQKKVGRELSHRIMKYIEFQQAAKRNNVSANQVRLLDLLSGHLHMEMAYDMYWTTIESHPFFAHMQDNDVMKKSLMRLCYSSFSIVPTDKDEFLFHLGDEGQTMLFVKTGCYEYQLVDGTLLERVLEPRLWVAEAVLWTSWRHRGTLIATVPSDALALNPTAFSSALRFHPKPWYLGVHYGVDFVNYLNCMPSNALTDVIFDAKVFVTSVKESDTYVLTRTKSEHTQRISEGEI